MKTRFLLLAVIGALAFAACGAPAATQASYTAPAATEAPMATQEALASGDTTPNTERLIIKNANLSIVVNDPLETVNLVTRLAEGAGGYVVSTNTFETTYFGEHARQANMVVRVPSDKLTPVLEQIKSLAVEVKSENTSGQDVTAEYVDLQSRLANLEAAEKQLQAIMEKAVKTEDVLKVYNQLVATREEIEVIKGQMKYYKESAAFSAITLDLIPNVVIQPIEVGGWHPDAVAKQSVETLARILQFLVDFLITFGIICGPFLLLLGTPAFLFIRWRIKRVAKLEREGTQS